MSKFILKCDRTLGCETVAKKGEAVYKFTGYDYGLSKDDTLYFDEAHISVTKDPTGEGYFFTVPVSYLKMETLIDNLTNDEFFNHVERGNPNCGKMKND